MTAPHDRLKARFGDLVVICNGCNQIMDDNGTWPYEYPKGSGRTLHTWRYYCKTCRTPSPDFDRGYPVGFSIVDTGEEPAA